MDLDPRSNVPVNNTDHYGKILKHDGLTSRGENRLAAILADAVGYSRPTGADEDDVKHISREWACRDDEGVPCRPAKPELTL